MSDCRKGFPARGDSTRTCRQFRQSKKPQPAFPPANHSNRPLRLLRQFGAPELREETFPAARLPQYANPCGRLRRRALAAARVRSPPSALASLPPPAAFSGSIAGRSGTRLSSRPPRLSVSSCFLSAPRAPSPFSSQAPPAAAYSAETELFLSKSHTPSVLP